MALMCFAARVLPRVIQDIVAAIGSGIGCMLMPRQRQWSRHYLTALYGRQPTTADVFRHFHAFTRMLLAKVRSGNGQPVEIICEGDDRQRAAILFGDTPMILGTFHVGASDLLGFHIHATGRKVCMVRRAVDNSADIEQLTRVHDNAIGFIWVNDPTEMILSLRDALQSNATVALQCDRDEGSRGGDVFHFLGTKRVFRTSVYRLARLFNRRVLFCIAIPDSGYQRFRILSHHCFDGSGLDDNNFRAAAHTHFQDVLHWLESILKQHPFQWFNFLPLNSPADPQPNGDQQ